MNEQNISAEIRKLVADKVASGVIVHIGYLTAEIVAGRDEISGNDAEWYRGCAYSVVRSIVKSSVAKYDAKETTDEQLVLDGFEHLQVAYSVTRGGDVVLVPVNQCTDEELRQRAIEYDTMAKGCRNHAREIRKFVLARSEALAA